MSDFLSLVRKVERGYRVSLGATMFNWSCSMNFAYRNTPPDPQVHWHVQPRYDHSVSFDGAMYNDPNFGDRALSTNTPIPDEAMAALEIALKSALSND